MRRIFIVEDHEVVADALAGVLGGIPGVEVVGIATRIRDALTQLPTLAPDIVVADLMLDDGSATEILRLIRVERLRTRVIVLTGLRDVYSANEALAAGAMGYVLKAQPTSELIEAIESVSTGRRYIAPKIAARIEAGVTSSGSRQGLECLTRRELEILRMLAHGYANREVAARLSLSTKTIETHRSNMNRKLALRNTVDLIRFAAAHGIGSAPLQNGAGDAAPPVGDIAGE